MKMWWTSFEAFWGHVCDCTDPGRALVMWVHELSTHPEVGDLNAPWWTDEQIWGFNVTVDDLDVSMEVVQPQQNLSLKTHCLPNTQWDPTWLRGWHGNVWGCHRAYRVPCTPLRLWFLLLPILLANTHNYIQECPVAFDDVGMVTVHKRSEFQIDLLLEGFIVHNLYVLCYNSQDCTLRAKGS